MENDVLMKEFFSDDERYADLIKIWKKMRMTWWQLICTRRN